MGFGALRELLDRGFRPGMGEVGSHTECLALIPRAWARAPLHTGFLSRCFKWRGGKRAGRKRPIQRRSGPEEHPAWTLKDAVERRRAQLAYADAIRSIKLLIPGRRGCQGSA